MGIVLRSLQLEALLTTSDLKAMEGQHKTLISHLTGNLATGTTCTALGLNQAFGLLPRAPLHARIRIVAHFIGLSFARFNADE